MKHLYRSFNRVGITLCIVASTPSLCAMEQESVMQQAQKLLYQLTGVIMTKLREQGMDSCCTILESQLLPHKI